MTRSFFEAILTSTKNVEGVLDAWRDTSTESHYRFESNMGVVMLRKRATYPATYAYCTETMLYFGYGNRELGEAVARGDLAEVPEEVFYDEEFLYGQANCADNAAVIQRDAFSTLPLFTLNLNGSCVIANQFERVCELIGTEKLEADLLSIVQVLTRQESDGPMLIKNMKPLYDRVRLVWRKGVSTFVLPPDSSLLETVKSRDGNPMYYHHAIETAMKDSLEKYTQDLVIGSELSGGTDSSLIARYCRPFRQHFICGSVIYPDEFGARQYGKIGELEQLLGITSHKVMMHPTSDYPLASQVRTGRWVPFYLNQELYAESFSKLADYFKDQSASIVLRGIGGDELGENLPNLIESRHVHPGRLLETQMNLSIPWLSGDFNEIVGETIRRTPNAFRPVSLLSRSVVRGSLSGNNQYIERGIWPVSPLANPRLYLYCQSLPIRYRSRKNLMRVYMQALGLPSSIYAPESNEHFGDFFYKAVKPNLQQHFFDIMSNSRLAKAGLINAEVACRSWETMPPRDFSVPGDRLFDLYRLMGIEITLQSLGHRNVIV